MTIDDVLLTTSEAAILLLQRPKTLRQWRCEGRGPRYIKFGTARSSRVYYLLSDLKAFMEMNAYRGTFEYGRTATPSTEASVTQAPVQRKRA